MKRFSQMRREYMYNIVYMDIYGVAYLPTVYHLSNRPFYECRVLVMTRLFKTNTEENCEELPRI